MTTDTLRGAFALDQGEGEHIAWSGGTVTLKTGEAPVAVAEITLRRGHEPPLHVHEHEDQWLHVLAGELTVLVGDERLPAGPGSFVWLPRGVPHTVELLTDELHAFAGATTPGWFHVFHELVEAFGGDVPPMLKPEDRQVYASVLARYDVRMPAS